MQTSGWLQLALYVIALAAITKPTGLYLVRVLDANGKTWFDPWLGPLERLTYRVMGVDSRQEHDWKQYTLAMLLFSLVGCLFTYAILRLQHLLPLNPQKFNALSAHLAFNTAVSFTTNTNWQSYSGETTMSYLSQMAGLAFHNFVSAATGIAIAAALVLNAFQGNVVFFFSPSEVEAKKAPVDKAFRVGGMVEKGSLKRQADGLTVNFVVTDTAKTIPVTYTGILPDLFKEGKGVVAQGKLGPDGVFHASEVLAKHDENYMPPEAAHALSKAEAEKAARSVTPGTSK